MTPELKSRFHAMELLERVLDKQQPLDQQLPDLYETDLPDRDRALARQLVMVVLRRKGELDAILNERITRPLPDKARRVRLVLYLGVAQLLWLKVPTHAAIDTSVNLVKILKFQPQARLVNAVLRRISEAKYQDRFELNAPQWMRESWQQAYGAEQTQAILAAHMIEPPLDITVASDVQNWSEKLEGEVIARHTVRRGNTNVSSLSGYDEGQWWVQDVAASLPAQLLGDVSGKEVLDVCAAPGGKTMQLLKAGAKVTALDRSSARLERLEENLKRIKAVAHIVRSDALKWKAPQRYDAIILDAPCSATGTIRRHPDIMHHRKPDDVAKVVELQQQILDCAVSWLQSGGVLIYCVCSLQPEEGEAQIDALLSRHANVTIEPIDAAAEGLNAQWVSERGMLRTLPCHLMEKGGMDGFFAARLRRG